MRGQEHHNLQSFPPDYKLIVPSGIEESGKILPTFKFAFFQQ